MRRFLFGFLWFIVLWVGSISVTGAVLGGIAGWRVAVGPNPPSSASEGFRKSFDAGHSLGRDFGRKYRAPFALGALAISIGGTAFGILPGTKRKPAAVNKPGSSGSLT